MNYEKNLKELESIVKKLSDEKMSVEEGLKYYERGISLAKESLNELNNVKGKMEILNKDLSALEADNDIEEDE